VVYIEELIGPDTVNTMPPATLDAFRQHGQPRASLVQDVVSAADTMAMVAEAGISMRDVTDKLLVEGVQLFSDAFEKLLKAVETQTRDAGAGRLNQLTYTLPEPLAAAVKTSWRNGAITARSGSSGRGMRRSGAARMKRSGLDGSALPTTSRPTSTA
jgi:transaldolase / glucose-6-phosphate isomerase